MNTDKQIIGIDIDGIYARLGKVSGQELNFFVDQIFQQPART
jgi:hypothetical protein